MTETTQTVFAQHQIRKTKKQKSKFQAYVNEIATREGYDFRVEKGYLGAKNIVVGDPDSAKIVFSAHYDTCPRLLFPNFITPKNIGLYLLYQVAVVLVFFFLPLALFSALAGILLGMLSINHETILTICALVEAFGWIGLLLLMLTGPANRHTANDNTSGVTALLDLMSSMPPEDRSRVAFVFSIWRRLGYSAPQALPPSTKSPCKTSPW